MSVVFSYFEVKLVLYTVICKVNAKHCFENESICPPDYYNCGHIRFRKCVSMGAAGARTRRSLGHLHLPLVAQMLSQTQNTESGRMPSAVSS